MNYSSAEKVASIYDLAFEDMEKDAVDAAETLKTIGKKGKKWGARALLAAGLLGGGAQGHAVLSAPVQHVGGLATQSAQSVLPGVPGTFSLTRGSEGGKKLLQLSHSTLKKERLTPNAPLLKTMPQVAKKSLGGLTASKTTVPITHEGAQRALTLIR